MKKNKKESLAIIGIRNNPMKKTTKTKKVKKIKKTSIEQLVKKFYSTKLSHAYGKAEVEFLKGRLKFGDSKNSAPFPSMICLFRAS